MRNMVLVSDCEGKAARARTGGGGCHTRNDHPSMDPKWRKTLLVCRAVDDGADTSVVPNVSIAHEDQVPMREDLLALVEIEELEKYFTPEELANHPSRRS